MIAMKSIWVRARNDRCPVKLLPYLGTAESSTIRSSFGGRHDTVFLIFINVALRKKHFRSCWGWFSELPWNDNAAASGHSDAGQIVRARWQLRSGSPVWCGVAPAESRLGWAQLTVSGIAQVSWIWVSRAFGRPVVAKIIFKLWIWHKFLIFTGCASK